MGTTVRQLSLRTSAGTRVGMNDASPRTACEIVTTLPGSCGRLLRSEDAQQLSACACVSAFPDVAPSERPCRIGHIPSSAQHAIRASGVDAQPGHIPTLATIMAMVRRTVARRWTTDTATPACARPIKVSSTRSPQSVVHSATEQVQHDEGGLPRRTDPLQSSRRPPRRSRRSVSVIANALRLVSVLGAAIAYSIASRGLSAHDEPSRAEELLARTMRSLATPPSCCPVTDVCLWECVEAHASP